MQTTTHTAVIAITYWDSRLEWQHKEGTNAEVVEQPYTGDITTA